MKKLIALLLAAVMVFALCACGAKTEAPAAEAPAAKKPAVKKKPAAKKTAADKKETIKKVCQFFLPHIIILIQYLDIWQLLHQKTP